MFISQEMYMAVLVATIQAHGQADDIGRVIQETVDAMIAADRKLVEVYAEAINSRQKKA